MVFADYLSRYAPSNGSQIELDEAIYMVTISNKKVASIQAATRKDPELSALKEQVTTGWPEIIKTVPKIIQPYWSMRDHLGIEDGVLYKGNRMIIPKCFQQDMIKRVHHGHQGITKCQLRVKESIFWTNIARDIEEEVTGCLICIEHGRSYAREPLLAHEVPSGPWDIIASDLFQLSGHHYIVIADTFSKMPFVRHLNKTTSAEVINFFKNIFSVHGIPSKLITDNSPQYSSTEFARFADEWDFQHTTTSPYHPQANSFIERMVGTVKQTLKKCKSANIDPQMALLCLCMTPINNKILSLAESLYRWVKTTSNSGDIRDLLVERKEKME